MEFEHYGSNCHSVTTLRHDFVGITEIFIQSHQICVGSDCQNRSLGTKAVDSLEKLISSVAWGWKVERAYFRRVVCRDGRVRFFLPKSSQVIYRLCMSQVKSSHPQKIELLESSRVKSWVQSSHFQHKSSQVTALHKSSLSRVSSHQSFSSQVPSQSLFSSQVFRQVKSFTWYCFKNFNLILHQFIENMFFISPWLHFNNC